MPDAAAGSAGGQRGSDLLWLALLAVAVIGTGIGVRDPWPADEPRFALIARDMVTSGDWLFPRVGGDLYADKPPVFFWLLAIVYTLTGSIRWSFLLPSFVAACGTVWLVYDLAARVAGREAARLAAGLLLFTVQFVMVTRGAQIDATLCFLTTLSLYGFLRHLLLGPAWGWCFVGAVAAGLGVVTKGVGFLPLLVFLPYALFRRGGFRSLPPFQGGARWLYVPLGFVLGTSVWLAPMLAAVVTRGADDLIAYRNEILFQQTVQRYAAAWHHTQPWYYFIVEVIPVLWLPASALLFWLVPRWRDAWRAKDARVLLPLAWSLLVLVFFSLSAGKRGVYILPALPAVVLAAAPLLPSVLARRGAGRLSLALGALLAGVAVILSIAALVGAAPAQRLAEEAGFDIRLPAVVLALATAGCWAWAYLRRPLVAWPAVLTALALVFSWLIAPQIDGQRSARDFIRTVSRSVPEDVELGLAGYKEQFLLQIDRPSVNFGHARWREPQSEMDDAAAWLVAAPRRELLIPDSYLAPCFVASPRRNAGRASRETWWIVTAPAAIQCTRRGNPDRAIYYRPEVLGAQ